MGGINCIKLLSANKGLLRKAAHNITTYSGHQELTQKNKISKVHFFVRHPVLLGLIDPIMMKYVYHHCHCFIYNLMPNQAVGMGTFSLINFYPILSQIPPGGGC